MFETVGNKDLLSKQVAAQIRDAIILKKYDIGDKLPSEQVLCSQFGVSRTAVREALRTLSAQGLISIIKGKGIFVTEPTIKNVTDPLHRYLQNKIGQPYAIEIIEARMIIEPEIARSAAINRTDADIAILEEDLKKYTACTSDSAEMAFLDMNFHLDIAGATKNILLPLMLRPVFKLMPDIKEKILKDIPEAHDSANIWHRKVLDAIIEGNPYKAYDAMKEHLLVAREHAARMVRIEEEAGNK